MYLHLESLLEKTNVLFNLIYIVGDGKGRKEK